MGNADVAPALTDPNAIRLAMCKNAAFFAGRPLTVDESSTEDELDAFHAVALAEWETNAKHCPTLTRKQRETNGHILSRVTSADVAAATRSGYRGWDAVEYADRVIRPRAISGSSQHASVLGGKFARVGAPRQGHRSSRSRSSTSRSSSNTSDDGEPPAPPLGRLPLTATDRRSLVEQIDAARRKQIADERARFAGYRECRRCWLDLPATEFGRGRSYCRACEAERVSEHRRKLVAA